MLSPSATARPVEAERATRNVGAIVVDLDPWLPPSTPRAEARPPCYCGRWRPDSCRPNAIIGSRAGAQERSWPRCAARRPARQTPNAFWAQRRQLAGDESATRPDAATFTSTSAILIPRVEHDPPARGRTVTSSARRADQSTASEEVQKALKASGCRASPDRTVLEEVDDVHAGPRREPGSQDGADDRRALATGVAKRQRPDERERDALDRHEAQRCPRLRPYRASASEDEPHHRVPVRERSSARGGPESRTCQRRA